jgi:phytoene desaturase
MTTKKIVVIGAGFGGLSAAALLAKDGHQVTVLEKHNMVGGRARVWQERGFSFDMGPSWYMMPEIYERYFALFGKKPSDYYSLSRLSPSYRAYFGENDKVDMPSDVEETYQLFESMEEGAGSKLREYLAQAEYQYEVSMKEFIYKDFNSVFDFFTKRMMTEGRKLHVFEKLSSFTNRYFKNERLRKLLEYSMVFLGGAPDNTPALYSVINHADLNLGVWYPQGGFGAVTNAFRKLAEEQGVKFEFGQSVTGFDYENNKIRRVKTANREFEADLVVSNADYHFVDQTLLEPQYRDYSPRWWNKRVVAPSAFIVYVGVNKKLSGLLHHTLFLDQDWTEHFNTIFNKPTWPEQPSFYVCVPSKTDDSVAPEGCENLFFLAPIAAGLADNPEVHQKLKNNLYDRLEKITNQKFKDNIVVERVFSLTDFSSDYNAFRGTGLGLAHTLWQTAYFRPRMRSKKLSNLYYVGHYTQPGIGVPMVVISGQIVSAKIAKEQNE